MHNACLNIIVHQQVDYYADAPYWYV